METAAALENDGANSKHRWKNGRDGAENPSVLSRFRPVQSLCSSTILSIVFQSCMFSAPSWILLLLLLRGEVDVTELESVSASTALDT